MPKPLQCSQCQQTIPPQQAAGKCPHCGAAVAGKRPQSSVSILQIFVRIGIAMFALAGSVGAGGLGVYWGLEIAKFKADLQKPETQLGMELARALDPMGFAKMQEQLATRAKVYPLLLLAMVFGLGGAMLASLNLGRIAGLPIKTLGGLLMIGGALIPAYVSPATLVFTFLLIPGGFLCFFRPTAKARPSADERQPSSRAA